VAEARLRKVLAVTSERMGVVMAVPHVGADQNRSQPMSSSEASEEIRIIRSIIMSKTPSQCLLKWRCNSILSLLIALTIAGKASLRAQVCDHSAKIAECERIAAENDANAARLGSKGSTAVLGGKGGPSMRSQYEQAAAAARQAATQYRAEHAQKCGKQLRSGGAMPGAAPGNPTQNIGGQPPKLFTIQTGPRVIINDNPIGLDPSYQQAAIQAHLSAKDFERQKAANEKAKLDQESRDILSDIEHVVNPPSVVKPSAAATPGTGETSIENHATAGPSSAPPTASQDVPVGPSLTMSMGEPDIYPFLPDDSAFSISDTSQLGAPWLNLNDRGGVQDVRPGMEDKGESPPSKELLEDAADLATRNAEARAATYEKRHPGQTFYGEGRCARGVLSGIGGALNVDDPGVFGSGRPYARDKAEVLEGIGMKSLDGHQSNEFLPQKGDVAIVEPVPPGVAGHMAIWNGRQWVSDYVQPSKGEWKDSLYPNQHYRSLRPTIKVYRRPN
jgi:hypothetical protein